MPVEIRELIIRATVGSSEEDQSSGGGQGKGKRALQKEREELVKVCVEQVLDILKDKQER